MAKIEDRAVELAREAQRIPVGGLFQLQRSGTLHGDGRGPFILVDRHFDDAVRAQGRQGNALAARTVRLRGELERARLDRLGELLRLGDVVDQLPFLRPVGAHALGGGAEHVGQIASDFSFINQSR